MAQNSCYQLLNHLINDIQKIDYQALLLAAEEKYGVKEFKISQITPVNAYEIYNNVYTKAKKNQIPKGELNWWENELRIFIWILVCYLELRSLKMDELSIPDWEFFSRLFPNKQEILFEYQALSLIKENINTKKWAPEEDQIFAGLVERRGEKYKWSQLAKELYIESNREFFRTPKQCRERWLNHLDPNKSKQEWQPKEDYILISHVRSKGKKWAEISKLLKNRRNEHSIKNRYKSLITREEKLNNDGADQQALLELLFKKYDNHFSKERQANPMISIQTNTESPSKDEGNQNMPTSQSILMMANKRAFQIYPPSNAVNSHSPQEQLTSHSLELHSMPSLMSSQSLSMNAVDREQRQKEIRAEMFLATDPFDFLKRFFRSKEYYE